MSSISINIDDFKRAADLFARSADSCKSQEARIEALTSELLQTWKGDSRNAFKSKYDEIKKGMYNYDEMLREISKELSKIADTFQEIDDDIKRELEK